MLKWIRKQFCPSCIPFGTGKLCEGCSHSPVERWCLRNANKATPDGIIAAAIIESIAKHFDDWAYRAVDYYAHDKNWVDDCKKFGISECLVNKRLVNEIKDLSVHWHSNGTFYYVNGTPLNWDEGRLIVQQFTKLQEKHNAVKAAAAKAIADQKRNEAAWNLAEKLLGMKRNEHGALVPIKTVEEPCEDCHKKDVMCREHQYKEKQSGEQTKDTGHQSPGGSGGFCPA